MHGQKNIKLCNWMSDDHIMKRKRYRMNRKEFRAFRVSFWHTSIVYFSVLLLWGRHVYEPCGTRYGSVYLRMRWKQITCNTVKCPISSTLCLWWWKGFLPHCICVLFCLKRDLRGFLSCALLHLTEFSHSLLLIPICIAVGTIPAWFCPFPTGISVTVTVRVSSPRTVRISCLTWTESWFLIIIIIGFLQAIKKHGRPDVLRRDILFYIIHVNFQVLVHFNIFVRLFVQRIFDHLR